MIIVELVYLLSVISLATYGINALVLAGIRKWRHKPIPIIQPDAATKWPQVTVQLPVYNERYVVERLLNAVESLDYPRDRLYIQVLDDSTDNTKDIVAQTVARQRAKGIDIEQIQRTNRQGYKGGALAHGMQQVKGEFIAIFDADFIPPPDFLKLTIPYFKEHPKIGCLQTRWGHINREASWLTRTQANGIDGHFVIEQETRSETPLFLNFNGTAGIWRKSCIEDAGGWHHDTLTEDLDLSYRAQLRGWQIRYLPHVTTPAELPAHINAFKRQQFRWAKGSMQTARKLLGDLWRSSFPSIVKIGGTIHLTHYAVHPLMLLNLILMLPLIQAKSPLINIFPLFTIGAIGPLFMYMVAMGEGGKPVWDRVKNLIMLILLGMGLSLNNTLAVAEALIGKQSSFKRTPKFNFQGQDSEHKFSDYLLPGDGRAWIEAMLAMYAFGLLVYVLIVGAWGLVIWLILYAGGYTYIASMNFRQSLKQARPQVGPVRRREPDTLVSQ